MGAALLALEGVEDAAVQRRGPALLGAGVGGRTRVLHMCSHVNQSINSLYTKEHRT